MRPGSAHAGLRYEIIAAHTTQPIFKLDGASHLAVSAILEYGQEHWGTLGEAMGILEKGVAPQTRHAEQIYHSSDYFHPRRLINIFMHTPISQYEPE